MEDEKQAVAGIRDDKIRKDGVGMSAAFTEYPEDTEFLFCFLSCFEVNARMSIF